jgi:hypothetical protein
MNSPDSGAAQLSDRQLVIKAHSGFTRAMARAMVIHRQRSDREDSRALGLCPRTSALLKRNQRVYRRSLAIPTVESMEQRVDAFEALVLVTG